MSDELTPITRKETFLAKAGGQNVETPTPITREETFLQAIIDNGSGGGGGALIATLNTQTGALDKTWNEINDADLTFMSFNIEGFLKATGLVAATIETESGYEVVVITYDTTQMSVGILHFTAESADGYPVASQ